MRLQTLDDLVGYIRDDVMPMVTRLEGCVGLSLMTDADTGRCIATNAWETEEAMSGNAQRIRPTRERVTEKFGATPDLQKWEIAVPTGRTGPGRIVRPGVVDPY